MPPPHSIELYDFAASHCAKPNVPQKNQKRVAGSDSGNHHAASVYCSIPVCIMSHGRPSWSRFNCDRRRAHHEARTNSVLPPIVFVSLVRTNGHKSTSRTLPQTHCYRRSAEADENATPPVNSLGCGSKLPLAMPQARDAPTDTLHPRKLLSAERRPLDSLGCQEAPEARNLEKSGRPRTNAFGQ